MKKISQEIDTLLFSYLEGKLEGEKLEKLKANLEKSEDLRNRLELLSMIHRSMGSETIAEPSPNFTQRVMSNLHRLPATEGLSPRNGLILLCGILVAVGIAIAMLDLGIYNSLNGILSFEELKVPTGFSTPTIPSISFNGKWVVNGIIALNLGLAFLILDRTILRPLFNRRSRMQF